MEVRGGGGVEVRGGGVEVVWSADRDASPTLWCQALILTAGGSACPGHVTDGHQPL